MTMPDRFEDLEERLAACRSVTMTAIALQREACALRARLEEASSELRAASDAASDSLMETWRARPPGHAMPPLPAPAGASRPEENGWQALTC